MFNSHILFTRIYYRHNLLIASRVGNSDEAKVAYLLMAAKARYMPAFVQEA
jgi:hypothetical protein